MEEETGYEALPLFYLGPFTYSIKSEENKTITLRTVYWFLMKVIRGSQRETNDEIKKVNLISINGDFSLLTYDSDRAFIKKAKEILDKSNFFK